ncbi:MULTISPECIES: hypothetical protein [unclassified Methylobacterium]|uniref:hypothetical protein n=1 Tax=unclassified Methylobacterium TaxID=2615210 RepID=UPI000302D760|nr:MULTISPECIES: hypothetical protein [unclassified Methylobacterium]
MSLNTFALTQPALTEFPSSEDGFTFDATRWLHPGRNILSVVLLGPAGAVPFRLLVEPSGTASWILDEADFLPLAAPWRLWTCAIEVGEAQEAASLGGAGGFLPGFLRRGDARRASA